MTSSALERDEFWMHWAISLARQAAFRQEVPVGAVIVQGDRLISTAFNLRETLQQPIAHAEILAIQRAAQTLQRWRLTDCELFVTLEPCLMCAGAIYQARFRRVIYAAKDPKGGALGSLYHIHEDTRLNHRYEVTAGVCQYEASSLLSSFFGERRRRGYPQGP